MLYVCKPDKTPQVSRLVCANELLQPIGCARQVRVYRVGPETTPGPGLLPSHTPVSLRVGAAASLCTTSNLTGKAKCLTQGHMPCKDV